MFGGVYSAATAMDAAIVRHEVASQNLAHAHMPGYRRQFVEQESFELLFDEAQQTRYTRDSLGTAIPSPILFDLSQGAIKHTEAPLDVAIQGEDFFVVEGPEGPLFTRNGSFHLDANGQLVTVDGLPVRGRGGPIIIPDASMSASITISQDGRIISGGVEQGQLEFARITAPATLTPVGASLFTVPDESVETGTDGTVVQGALELSNVEPVMELVSILIGSRQYEAAQRAITTMSESVQQHVSAQNGG